MSERLKKRFLRLAERFVFLVFLTFLFLVFGALDDRVLDLRDFLLVLAGDFFLLVDMSIDIDECFISL